MLRRRACHIFLEKAIIFLHTLRERWRIYFSSVANHGNLRIEIVLPVEAKNAPRFEVQRHRYAAMKK